MPDRGAQLYRALIDFLRDDDWPVAEEDESERSFAVAVEGTNGRWVCVGQIARARPVLQFWSLVPVFVPPGARPAVAEYLHRATCGVFTGGFQFDWDEGDVRFLTSIDLGDDGPDMPDELLRPMLRQMVYLNVSTADRYLPGLMQVIHAGVAPADAVAAADAAAGETTPAPTGS